MFRILALSKEEDVFDEIRCLLRKDEEIELERKDDVLNFLEGFIGRYTKAVILDLDLLDGEAEKLIRILKNIRRDVKIVLVLSKKKMDVCSQLLQFGIFSYLVKPISIATASEILISAVKSRVRNKE